MSFNDRDCGTFGLEQDAGMGEDAQQLA